MNVDKIVKDRLGENAVSEILEAANDGAMDIRHLTTISQHLGVAGKHQMRKKSISCPKEEVIDILNDWGKSKQFTGLAAEETKDTVVEAINQAQLYPLHNKLTTIYKEAYSPLNTNALPFKLSDWTNWDEDEEEVPAAAI